MPALAGSLQVAVNTDMSIGLAILVGFLSVAVTVALWCGLLQRLMQAGGILQEAADAARSHLTLTLTLTLILTPTLTLPVPLTLTLSPNPNPRLVALRLGAAQRGRRVR